MDGRNWNWNCNWNWNSVVDVSSFLLCESTGDSEANSDLNKASISSGDNMEVITTYEVDDAQSCCSNLSDSFRDYNHHDQDQEYAQCPKKKSDKKYKKKCPKKKGQEYAQSSKKKEHEHASYGGYNPNYRDSNDEEDDGAIDQDWTCGKMGFVVSKQKRNTNKSKVSTVEEPVKEEEKDKLFWDNCLGS